MVPMSNKLFDIGTMDLQENQDHGYCRTIDGDQAAVIDRKGKNELLKAGD
jgi:hypothetical protein